MPARAERQMSEQARAQAPVQLQQLERQTTCALSASSWVRPP